MKVKIWLCNTRQKMAVQEKTNMAVQYMKKHTCSKPYKIWLYNTRQNMPVQHKTKCEYETQDETI